MKRKSQAMERKLKTIGRLLRNPTYGWDSGLYVNTKLAMLKLSLDDLLGLELILDQEKVFIAQHAKEWLEVHGF